jgi:hypothetical protein
MAADNIVLRWNEAVLDAIRVSRFGPPITSRVLAIVHTCAFDAWAAYDDTAVGTRMGDSLRQPVEKRTLANKEKAISFAAYRGAIDLFPANAPAFAQHMVSLGYDPLDTSVDVTTPAGVGNVASKAVIEFRHHDGSNQLGDMNGGAPYSDYTGYLPSNPPMDLTRPFDPTSVQDASRWQPLRYVDVAGVLVTPGFTTPQWNKVKPFSLPSGSFLRSASPPAKYGSAAYVDQARQVLQVSAGLTDEHKAMVEYWADGPRSEQPPGHWNVLAGVVSRRAGHSLDRDAQLFFVLNNALLDAGIVAWDDKSAFDAERPITAVRRLFAGKQVDAWAGPFQGTRMIDGAAWMPYQPSTVPTPPFPEFTSGHSTFSSAAGETMRLFGSSDAFEYSTTIAAGSSKVEPGAVPASPVVLHWPTFSSAAAQAGWSRRLGGIHFEQADLEGRRSGLIAGRLAFNAGARFIRGISPS